ncbi:MULTISPECIES: hypothetical protein [unclassified Bradyrhizobium]|uniref:hypothetical protein n=1 Tax=unclassified Bradyrhizobium TaxID=2631580 RepID=UPI0029162EA6|nr:MULTISPECIES: hypothetical protein [unclassified Bradyrhizobium]
MTDETQQTLPQPPSGGSWLRQADGSLVPNVPAAGQDATADAPKAKPEKKGK